MRPFCSPLEMQGSFFRSFPSRASLSVCTSVYRKISWYQFEHLADFVSSKSVNSAPPLPSAARIERFRRDTGLNNGVRSIGSRSELSLPEDPQKNNEERFRSIGSRSEPSLPSIQGKFSKYSKRISKLHTAVSQERSERRDKKAFRKPMGDIAAESDGNVISADESSSSDYTGKPVQKPSNLAVPASEIPDWMQQYQFSYSEVPKVPIIGFRQIPWSPFGPADMIERPWTGSAPLKPSKKKLPEFDSFNPPPYGKKGVKYVQRPGPFPPGQGPKPAKTREEILGTPLTPLEIQELVTAVNKGDKQLNLGRDGLTHNMLDVIHSHWKRSVCCKIKCKGVPTLDMDNVARVVEERSGGVIIHRAGGVMYVFRGRNYNYKDRPKLPIMLWKPPDPIYPRLIQPVPEGLTEHEAKQLRGKGRKVAPLCKLSKNGVYLTLVTEVRAQLEIDEVVKVDCQGMKPTDYKKIGAKLKDLVPCTLLSFEKEQIIMCRKRPAEVENVQQTQEVKQAIDFSMHGGCSPSGMEESVLQVEEDERKLVLADCVNSAMSHSESAVVADNSQGPVCTMDENPQDQSLSVDGNFEVSLLDMDVNRNSAASGTDLSTKDAILSRNGSTEDLTSAIDEPMVVSSSVRDEEIVGSSITCTDNVEALWQKAIEDGKAFELDNQTTDTGVIFGNATELSGILDEVEDASLTKDNTEKEKTTQQNEIGPQICSTSPFDEPPMGGLRVDELANLLAP